MGLHLLPHGPAAGMCLQATEQKQELEKPPLGMARGLPALLPFSLQPFRSGASPLVASGPFLAPTIRVVGC